MVSSGAQSGPSATMNLPSASTPTLRLTLTEGAAAMASTRRHGRARRVVTRVLIGLGVTVAVVTAAYVVLMTLPLDQQARAADVVYVIGPPTDARIAEAEALIDDGMADALMISISLPDDDAPVDTGWAKPDRPAWAAWSSTTRIAYTLCADPDAAALELGVPVVCAQPAPFTTQGEARELAATLAAEGWSSATVITTTPHVNRTRLLVSRCTDAAVQVIGADGDIGTFGAWLWQALYEVGGFVKAFATPGC